MRKYFLILIVVLGLFLAACGPAASNFGRAIEDLLHMVTLVVYGGVALFSIGVVVQLVRERRAPKRRWYLPAIGLALFVPSVFAGGVWGQGFAPDPWDLSTRDIPYLWGSIVGPIAVAASLPFFSQRPARRVIWLVGGAHLLLGYMALVVHTISAGKPAFGTSEITDIQTSGQLSCILSKNGTLACAMWKPQLMKVQPLASMAVRADRVCGIGREHHTVWCADFGQQGQPSDFWRVEGIDDARKIVLGPKRGCVVRSGERVACFSSGAITDTYEAKDVALGNNESCFVDRDDRATCGTWTADDVKSIAAGDGFACAVKKNGEVECSGGPIKSETLRDVDQIAAGETHVCVRQGGTVRCGGWGSQVGVGDLDVSHPDPMAVALPGRAVDIRTTPTTSCATLDDGSIYCWGRAAFVQEAEWCGFLQSALCTTRPSHVSFDQI